MKHRCKRIEVCHGPTCGTHGAQRILGTLKAAFEKEGTEIIPRGCCGRCSFNNSIVVDGQTVSKLSPATIDTQFIQRIDESLAEAKDFDAEANEQLDSFLNSDLLMP